ncbi:MAG: phage Gp37/Gp68 family protein [Methyloversatilis discipulorum]|uniref:phage Gp37/Gp68 family protein n=1 Tax=Methyloversatilis discipulorum TaxID=1119528 RepID=UPI0026EADD2C|nr:phage Gp37/Gp68 family protein [Methyloversatilis discipulorum]MBT9516741.1 phage Gp37/Gp68 family protein [Methyloversatilis discipulorum]
MAERSNIEWCDVTFNPWIGCTKVSPACDHCYAERDFDLRRHVVQWGAGQARKRTGDDNWKKPGKWNAKPFFQCEDCGHRSDGEKWREVGPNMGLTDSGYACPRCNSRSMNEARRRVFCASLADVFDNEVDPQWRADLFRLIEASPNLDWLLLTKRIGNVRSMAPVSWLGGPVQHGPDPCNIHGGWPANVWLGATICNQAEADRDIPKLLDVPAAVRFVSIEPMLGPVDLTDIVVRHGGGTEDHFSALYDADDDEADTASYIDWVIVGGESGPHARPMHPEWARDLRDQCAAAGVPFLFKQWGEFSAAPPASVKPGERWPATSRLVPVSGNTYAWENFRALEARDLWMHRIGKKAAGRLLDGRTHDAFPKGGA